MGKLRFEPKVKPLVSNEEYQLYKDSLLKAQSASNQNHVFWDLDSSENPTKTRKKFLYVAEKEGLDLNVRADRENHCLKLSFSRTAKATNRMSAEDSRKRILEALNSVNHPLKKGEIVDKAGISTSTWNLRIKELIEDKLVKRQGSGRETQYLTK